MLENYEEYFLNPTMKEYFHEARLYTLQLEVTTRCPQNCIYCYTRYDVPQLQDMSLSTLKNIIEDAGEMEVVKIEWLGGDVLLYPHWRELMDLATEHGIINNIWTAGSLLEDHTTAKDVVRATSGGGLVSIHIDTINEEDYKKLHKNHPSFIKATFDGLEELISLGKSPNELLNCMTFSSLVANKRFEEIVDFFMENYGMTTSIVVYKPVVPGLDYLIPNLEQVRHAVEYKNQKNFSVEVPAIPQCVSKFYCGTTASVMVNGGLSVCSRIRHAVAKLGNRRFKEAFNEYRDILVTKQLQQHQFLDPSCQKCAFNNICWGCRANAWYYNKSFFAGDPKCWHRATLQ
ncbi:MAG: radical SAM/SPASM domain-containing protein [Candidatus Hermodarchaeota archaeon]